MKPVFKVAVIICFGLFLFGLWAASPAAVLAEDKLLLNMTDEYLEGILSDLGLDYKRLRPGAYHFKLNSYEVVLFNQGVDMQLYAGFNTITTPEKVNEWNRSNRFCRAYVDREGHGVLESDLNLDGGVGRDNVVNFITNFRITLGAFADSI